ncbi:PEP-CTERM sorting domain-containing protein [Aquabacterium sp.]|uniref:PEP-CTERM sorting domain-containing protein n=1 Tax=Aquabacterium sp. TaxID=1872578 RepID=UPI002E35B7E3|nr:PEP-CTERM sorting domain-containing protein [Aquabacterium sp.]HEX5313241.1 PEP-CTERM sorting domain-containing protein [Aquabacterium sp.]
MFKHVRRVAKVVAVGGAMSWAGVAFAAGAVSGQGTWESTLQARDLNHDGQIDAFYDTSLNISWLSDAFAEGPPVGFPAGRPIRFWGEAHEWTLNLDVHGVKGWRLPSVVNDFFATDPGGRHCPIDTFDGASHTLCGFNSDVTRSELAHMYYVTLGNKAPLALDGSPQAGSGLTNTGPFTDLREAIYWTGTHHDQGGYVWAFGMAGGWQNVDDPFHGFPYGTWAVHDGDVGALAAVPEPESVAMVLAGGLTLAGILARRHRAALA